MLSRTYRLKIKFSEHSVAARWLRKLIELFHQSGLRSVLVNGAAWLGQNQFVLPSCERLLILVCCLLPLTQHRSFLLILLILTAVARQDQSWLRQMDLIWFGLIATWAAFFSPRFLSGLVELKELWFGLGVAYLAKGAFSKQFVVKLLRYLVWFSLFWILLGYQQYLAKVTIPNGWLEAGQLVEIGTRIYAVFGNPNVYGVYLLTILIFARYLLIITPKWWEQFFYGLVILLGLVSVYLTYSRTAWLIGGGLLISWSWRVLGKRRWLVYLLGAALLANSTGFQVRMGKLWTLKDTTLGYRIKIWAATWQAIVRNGLWGAGPGSFRLVYPEFQIGETLAIHAHQFYLQLWLEYGLCTLLAWFWLIGQSLIDWRRNLRSKTFGAVIIIFLVAGLTETWSDSWFLKSYFWLLLGIARALPTLERTK